MSKYSFAGKRKFRTELKYIKKAFYNVVSHKVKVSPGIDSVTMAKWNYSPSICVALGWHQNHQGIVHFKSRTVFFSSTKFFSQVIFDDNKSRQAHQSRN